MKKNIITIINTRPDVIRLSKIIKKLDNLKDINHLFIHTGQNFTQELHNNIFESLDLRKPDIQLNNDKLTGYDFTGFCMKELDEILSCFSPNNTKILILGDVNGAFCSSYVAKKRGFKIFHMEAGNRCYDDAVPEEVNRRAIDGMSYKLLPYTQRSRETLLHEGFHPKDIIVVGNPIGEIVDEFREKGMISDFYEVVEDSLPKNIQEIIRTTKYDLVTFHRTENVEDEYILNFFMTTLHVLANTTGKKYLLSVHPKLKDKLKKHSNRKYSENIIFCEPFNLNQFLFLELNADVIISDSGTVPEEAAIFGTPCLLVRTSTERPELLETNNMIVCNPSNFLLQYNNINNFKYEGIPPEYNIPTSEIVCKILLGDL